MVGTVRGRVRGLGRVVPAVALALTLAACGAPSGGAPSGGPDVPEAADGPAAPQGPPRTAPEPEDGARPDGSPEPDDTPTSGPCDDPTATAIAAPVARQLDALADADFAAAHAEASPFFRTVVGPERFEALIRDGYPELLDVAERRLEGCTVRGRRAVLVVTVTTSTGVGRTLAYLLSDTDDEGWRIDGADDAAPAGPEPADPTV